ncbi:hypothetical protein ACFV90_40770 [Streptomyces sp. NPDC059904]|uniref:hypothetical protein n=1 Tax=Streptomyces sp. NPDC059904 TaxID=3346996 RepID=UPI00365909C3
MTAKPRNIPSGTSQLAPGPPPPPQLGPLKVGKSSEPSEDQELTEHDQDDDAVPPRKSKPGRSRGGRRPAPEAASAVPTTVRFDPEEASEVDFFVLELRDDAARRTLDKAEVIRELLRLAREHEPTKKALLKRLR